MTLSARIAVGPSSRLAVWSAIGPSAAVVVAAVTLAARWPQVGAPIVAAAVVGCAAVVLASGRRHRGAPRCVLSVTDHAAFDVVPDPVGTDGSWRLARSTVVWPGFTMLAIRKADPSISSRVVRMAVFDAELAARDRRSLGRFLLWSLRGGDLADRGVPSSAGRS